MGGNKPLSLLTDKLLGSEYNWKHHIKTPYGKGEDNPQVINKIKLHSLWAEEEFYRSYYYCVFFDSGSKHPNDDSTGFK